MSDHCSFVLRCDLSPDTPPRVLRTLHDWYDVAILGGDCAPQRKVVHVRDDVPNDELEAYVGLLSWIAPYSTTDGLVGYVRLPHDVHPTLFYFRDGEVSVF